MACGDHKHPLQRDGTSQAQRPAPGLDAGYVRVDEKDLADWIVYAEALAGFIRFHNLQNAPDQDWKPFFSRDISAVLAFVAVQDPDGLRGIGTRFARLRDDANQGDPALLRQILGELFGAALTLASALDGIQARLPAEPSNGLSLRLVIASLIRFKLAPVLGRVLAFHKAALADGLITEADVPAWRLLGRPVRPASAVIAAGLEDDWITGGAADWATYAAGIVADPSIFGPSPAVAAKIRHAATHNLFTSLFDQFLAAYARILKAARTDLELTLEEWRKHPPHYTLFLAFLKLLKAAQADLNQGTRRHLEFYYRDVLQLRPQTPAPDSAHVVIELAKSASAHLLPAGTLFRAGKDSAGQEVVYRLTRDQVFNKAAVARLMAVYRGGARDNLPGTLNEGRWFAAPAINSADGLGAPLVSARGEWHPFINRTLADGRVQSIDEPRAVIGFAVASHCLAAAEGRRVLILRLGTSANAAVAGLHCEVFLTTAKGWHQAAAVTLGVGTMADGGTPCATITVTLEPQDPGIANYDPKIHGGTLGVRVPVAKVMLRHVAGQAYDYDAVRNVTVAKVEVQTDVGSPASGTFTAEGVKMLALSSTAGSLDPAKPFLPFGPQPVAGDVLIIGCPEVFSKRGAKVRFNAEWIKLPNDAEKLVYDGTSGVSTPTAALEYLSGGVWKTLGGAVAPFNGITSQVSFPSGLRTLPADACVPPDVAPGPLSTQSAGGYFRLRLNGGFGHKEYLAALTKHWIVQAKTPSDAQPPAEPYAPTLQALQVSYTASASATLTGEDQAAFAAREVRFFHLYPFGDAEQHRQLSGENAVFLLPQFRYVEPAGSSGAGTGGVPLLNQAEFYVGLEGVAGGESVSFLFQVLEGTADPLLLKPAEHVQISYLSGNSWRAIPRHLIEDSTRQLIQSGLIKMALPRDATATGTMLPAGLLWLRFSVAEAADAVCKLLAVLPQAALVTYEAGPLNAPDFPTGPLPAGTIAKLKEPSGAIKKVEQPYPSFRNGQGGETDAAFELRVSERLRHKDRAITLWDYERLVLQAFPQIHLVKCLSHTKLVPDPDHPGQTLYSELAPGYVLVVTVPSLVGRNDADPLRPYTSAGLLAEVQEFLRARVSAQAEVIVANPLFEEIRLEFTVTLAAGYDDVAFYRELLQKELTEHLTPWAFGGSTDIHFGGRIYKSVLIDFVEERPYVDYLVDVKLYHKAGDGAVESGDLEEVVASTARSILVSAPAVRHNITVLAPEPPAEITEECNHD